MALLPKTYQDINKQPTEYSHQPHIVVNPMSQAVGEVGRVAVHSGMHLPGLVAAVVAAVVGGLVAGSE